MSTAIMTMMATLLLLKKSSVFDTASTTAAVFSFALSFSLFSFDIMMSLLLLNRAQIYKKIIN